MHQQGKDAKAAQTAYARRTANRSRRQRAEAQAMKRERERLALAHAIRRELANLADGAADLEVQATSRGKAAAEAEARLQARRRRAKEALSQADRFGLDAGLAEIATADRKALELPEQ